MKNFIAKKINESSTARWTVVALVSFTMLCGYFLTDVMAPLKTMLENELNWSSTDYGIFTSGYGWINIFAFMLIISGIVLDKLGVRFTGITATIIMIAGALIKYWAISSTFENPIIKIDLGFYLIEMKRQVLYAALGYAIFGVGVETIGITASKSIVKWFKGKEMALALGLNVATGRLGTLLALAVSPIIASKMKHPSAPILLCLIFLVIGLLSFIVFCVMDKKYDKEALSTEDNNTEKENFKIKDILGIVKIKGFWYIAILCLLFYSAVFPYLKYASDLMVQKFGLPADLSGIIPSLLPMGTLFLTPLFGNIYDKKGRGASIMILGSIMLVVTHLLFAIPGLNNWMVAVVLTIVLGIAFSMVPSAMWPSLPKIIDERQLGTAYSVIFWIQNIGLSGVPLLIGYVLDKYCIIGKNMVGDKEVVMYDYTLPMLIFSVFGMIGLVFAFLLKKEDAKKGYGLELPNIKK